MMITAHSGCDNTPENSLEFVRHALEIGTDAIEIDVRRNPGGWLILSHNLPEQTLKLPSLAAVFDMAENSVCLINCDLKEAGIEEAVLSLAAVHGMRDRIILTGTVRTDPPVPFSSRTFINLENLIPEAEEKLSRGLPVTPEEAASAVDRAARAHFPVINLNFRTVSDALLAAAAERNIRLSFWTVDTPEEIRRVLSYHPYNITSRAPMLVRKIAEEAGIAL